MTPKTAAAGNAKLLDDFNTVVAETEHLLKSVASLGDDKGSLIKDNVDEALAAASARLARIREKSAAQATAAARAADDYVQENPWRAMGFVALAAAVAGLIAGVAISRRAD